MKRVFGLLPAVLLGLLAGQSAAQIPVTDGISNARRTLEFIWMQGQEIKKYAEMVTTAKQMVEQVKGTYQMIEMAAEHLKTMPTDWNILAWLSATNDQASQLLGQVQGIGFMLDRTSRQFETLYGHTLALTTPEGREQRYQAMRAARLEMTSIAMQTQSIKQTFGDIFSRLSTLLGIASWAEGTRALQQIQIQQQALLQKQQLGLTIETVHARLVAMQQAEEIVREQLSEEAAKRNAQHFMEGYNTILFRGPGEGRGFQLPN